MGKATSSKRGRRADMNERPLIRARREMLQLEMEGEALADNRVALINWRFRIDEARRRLLLLENEDRARWCKGTPETHDQIDDIPAERRQAALGTLYERGKMNDDQFRAYNEIATIIEMIESDVSVKSSGYQDQVDNGGSGDDGLIEGLARVRLEATYTAWRDSLPVRTPPRGAILDLIKTTQSLRGIANAYRVDRNALKAATLRALDHWAEIKEATWRNVDADDVNEIYRRIGCGMLRAPRPKGVAS
jgi:hypothetical protein